MGCTFAPYKSINSAINLSLCVVYRLACKSEVYSVHTQVALQVTLFRGKKKRKKRKKKESKCKCKSFEGKEIHLNFLERNLVVY